MKGKRFFVLLVLLLVLPVLLAGCGDSGDYEDLVPEGKLAGVEVGFLDGFTAPIFFLLNLFEENEEDKTVIYREENKGDEYLIGFIIGIWLLFSIFFGGGGTAATSSRRRS